MTTKDANKIKVKQLRKIVFTRSFGRVGNATVDLTTATFILALYDRLRPDHQERYLTYSLQQMAQIAFMAVKMAPHTESDCG